MTVRTRFAPSPTGYLHLGSVRTALYCWLFARHHDGEYFVRIEDTDRERSTQAAVDAVVEGLRWTGLEGDEDPIYQSARFDRYREVIAQMLEAGTAYRCYCTREDIEAMRAEALSKGQKPRYDGRCRAIQSQRPDSPHVVRFRNPSSGQVVVNDLVKGRVVYENDELDDLIIARSDGTPTYNLTVVVDDGDMGITHVIRGDDHLNNTPRQINMLRALGIDLPEYAHLPMIHGSDGAKLSKRHGAVNILEYREMGFLPDAMLNYLLRLGWSLGDREIFTRAEMVQAFDLRRISRSASNFDPRKLLWVNQQHLQMTPVAELAPLLDAQLRSLQLDSAAGPPLEAAVVALRERGQTLRELAELAVPYYGEIGEYEPQAAKRHLGAGAAESLEAVRAALSAIEAWSESELDSAVERAAERLQQKLGKVAQPLRVALTGRAASPGIGVTLQLVGRDRALARIDAAIAFIKRRSAAPDGSLDPMAGDT